MAMSLHTFSTQITSHWTSNSYTYPPRGAQLSLPFTVLPVSTSNADTSISPETSFGQQQVARAAEAGFRSLFLGVIRQHRTASWQRMVCTLRTTGNLKRDWLRRTFRVCPCASVARGPQSPRFQKAWRRPQAGCSRYGWPPRSTGDSQFARPRYCLAARIITWWLLSSFPAKVIFVSGELNRPLNEDVVVTDVP